MENVEVFWQLLLLFFFSIHCYDFFKTVIGSFHLFINLVFKILFFLLAHIIWNYMFILLSARVCACKRIPVGGNRIGRGGDENCPGDLVLPMCNTRALSFSKAGILLSDSLTVMVIRDVTLSVDF